MVDPESVRRRMREIDRRVDALRAIHEQGRDRFMAEDRQRAAAERHLQLALQSAIDIALHIVAEDSSLTPEDYGLAFSSLTELGVLDAELAIRLRRGAGLRNILVHGYLEVDPERLWDHLADLELFESFAAAIATYLER